MTSLLAPRALARAVVLLALALLAAAPARAQLRTYDVRWMPQGSMVAQGYDLHLRLDGSTTWSVVDLRFVPTDTSGIASYPILLNDDLDYDLAISAYVLEGAKKISSPLSNIVGVVALEAMRCAVNADCSDGNVCNGGERCLAGVCSAGSALTCADPGPCQAAVCDPTRGCLVVDDLADPTCQAGCAVDADCSDGNVCNGGERCLAGVCSAGSALTCADPGPCQAAVCDPTRGCLVVDDLADPTCQPDPEPAEGPQPELRDVAIDLDGSGEQLGTSGAATLGIATEFTLSMWVKPTGLQERQYLFQVFSPGTTAQRSGIVVVAANQLSNDPIRLVTYDYAGNVLQARDYENEQRPGEWLHVVMAQPANGSHLHAYFDGVATDATTVRHDGSWTMADWPREIVLGTDYTRLQNFFRGSIGHVALWNRQLTAAEVAEIHARGHDIDLRVNTGAYVSASSLRHYWRLGEIPSAPGTDFVPNAPVPLDQTVGLDASDVVPGAP